MKLRRLALCSDGNWSETWPFEAIRLVEALIDEQDEEDSKCCGTCRYWGRNSEHSGECLKHEFNDWVADTWGCKSWDQYDPKNLHE